MTLAEYLTRLRQRSRITPGNWAAKSGISRSSLWRWEQGKALPRDEELRQALAALDVSPAEKTQAMETLLQERVARGIGAMPAFTATGLNRNELLRALRSRVGYSQQEAAERLGVNRVTLANWERGDHWPDVTVLHQLCLKYGASPTELAALTTLSIPTSDALPTQPDDVVWDDIETYSGDFGDLELHYLTNRARLSQMPQALAREREIACTLDYLHWLASDGHAAVARRELRRIASHPTLLASPTLFVRHKAFNAIAQKQIPGGDAIAVRLLRSLGDLEDTMPARERVRVKAEWAFRSVRLGEKETSRRLSDAALADAKASGDPHLLAVGQREYAANRIDLQEFSAAARALEDFPTHTPLFIVHKLFTYASLLREAGSRQEAISAYRESARAAQAMGMSGYATYFNSLGDELVLNET